MMSSILIAGALLSAVLTCAMCVATCILTARAGGLRFGTKPISVLKPVKGLDDELEQNLESFCRQLHPCYELIVGAADPNDPALAVARRVKQRHPEVAFQIVSGQWATGLNPKIRNLRHLLTRARYSSILVSDGDVRVDSDYLSVMAGALECRNVGLVSNLVVGVGGRTVGATCENLRLNGFVANCVASAQVLARHPVVVGKSMLFRRDALTNVGGFAAAADVLAEDYLLGRAVVAAGYRVVTLGYPVWAVSRNWSLRKMLQRHTRWSQMRRHLSPGIYALEPFGLPVIWLMLLMATKGLIPSDDFYLNGVHSLVLGWLWLAVLLEATIAVWLQRAHGRFESLLWWPASSLLGLSAWLFAWAHDIVIWREQRYTIGAGSRLSPARMTPLRNGANGGLSEAA